MRVIKLQMSTWNRTIRSAVNCEVISMTKQRNRIVSAVVGTVISVLAIILDLQLPGRERQVQIVVWTLVVAAMATLINHQHIRENWFWQGCCVGLTLHVALVYGLRYSLPFSSVGVALLIGFAEVLAWQLVFRTLSTTNRTGNDHFD